MLDLRFESLDILSGYAFFVLSDIFDSAFRYDVSAVSAAFRSQVDNPVAGTDDIRIMLNNNDGIAFVHQLAQHS